MLLCTHISIQEQQPHAQQDFVQTVSGISMSVEKYRIQTANSWTYTTPQSAVLLVLLRTFPKVVHLRLHDYYTFTDEERDFIQKMPLKTLHTEQCSSFFNKAPSCPVIYSPAL